MLQSQDPAGHRAEGDLLARAGGGDEGAFSALYDATAPTVFGLALRMLGDRARAEEATAAIYLQVWHTAASFDADQQTCRSWVLAIAHRELAELVRVVDATVRAERHQDSSEDLEVDDRVGDLERVGASGGAEVIALHADIPMHFERPTPDGTGGLLMAVEPAMAQLGDSQRQALQLAYFGGLTHHEVDDVMGIRVGATATRICDGLRTLRDILTGDTGFGPVTVR